MAIVGHNRDDEEMERNLTSDEFTGPGSLENRGIFGFLSKMLKTGNPPKFDTWRIFVTIVAFLMIFLGIIVIGVLAKHSGANRGTEIIGPVVPVPEPQVENSTVVPTSSTTKKPRTEPKDPVSHIYQAYQAGNLTEPDFLFKNCRDGKIKGIKCELTFTNTTIMFTGYGAGKQTAKFFCANKATGHFFQKEYSRSKPAAEDLGFVDKCEV